MWIKICANTSLQDALRAAEAGADAVGFVFAPSKRQVMPLQVGAITPELPYDLTQVGVFVSRDFDEIADTVRTAGLHGIQLHGGLDQPLVERLRAAFDRETFLIQTLHWPIEDDPAATAQALFDDYRAVSRQGLADAVLLDARTASASGGTGKTIDWERARAALAGERSGLRIILAGGLTPLNVAEAIRTLRPWGVDVASGVEAQPGKKDPARLRDFIQNARTAFAEIENRLPTPLSS
jgi:phosphoribosylanthranilate isomerase